VESHICSVKSNTLQPEQTSQIIALFSVAPSLPQNLKATTAYYIGVSDVRMWKYSLTWEVNLC